MPLTDFQKKVKFLVEEEGLSRSQIAAKLGCTKANITNTYHRAKANAAGDRGMGNDVFETLTEVGLGDVKGQHSGWVHRKNEETGTWASVYYLLGKDGNVDDVENVVKFAVENSGQRPAKPVTPKPSGDNTLVINMADVHVNRLCIFQETGFDYSGKVAMERVMVGTERLLERAKKFGVGNIILTVGNDKLHFDTPRQTTTSGTFQQADTTVHQMYRNAKEVDKFMFDACRAVAPTTGIFVPANHDWVLGFCLAQDIKSYYRDCPEVIFSDYAASERHRKYALVGRSLLVFTHGDGAKHRDLPQLIMSEARTVLGDVDHIYVFEGHTHHKNRMKLSMHAEQIEKDYPGMTVIAGQTPAVTRPEIQVEVVRSPAPPDGWHDRNGYRNKQAVEAWLHDDAGTQFARFTEFF